MKNEKISSLLDAATGIIDYQFTNDYMFRAILQKNKKVLQALICALLHLPYEDIKSLDITNPIELGQKIDDKDFILDIVVCLNNDTLINLEMQVTDQLNWEERSLCYLCRTFDQLNSGQNYIESKSAIHIGFLDFTPAGKIPEFYGLYQLTNIKNHHLYSDKFTLGVVNLTQIELATADDKACQLDHWAKLFKSTTWEEIKMIAKKDEYLREASETLYVMNADEIVRQQCQARADYYRLHNSINQKMEELSSQVEKLSSENDSLTSENDSLTSENEILKKLLEENGISY